MTSHPTRISGRFVAATLGLVLFLAGCARTRSISNSGAMAESADHGGSGTAATETRSTGPTDPGFEYRGELNEFDVLGVDRDQTTTDAEIARALDAARTVTLKPGSRVLLVQSGAVFPDAPMVAALENEFQIVPFSGVPPRQRTAADPEPSPSFSYGKNLRLAAARAGAENILCYWGTLESARRKLETKTVSWVPIAGWMIPDEAQHMRIRLKLALIDVRSGNWRVLTPEPFTDKAWSTAFTRGSSDRKQVELLKEKAYAAGAEKVMKEFASVTGVP